MKISLIIPSFYPAIIYGGPIFTTMNTSKALAELGVEIRVSTTNANKTSRLNVTKNEWIQFQENFFVKYYNATKLKILSLPMLFNIWKDIKQADLVHLQIVFGSVTPIAILCARLFNKPLLLTPHGIFSIWSLASGSPLKKLWLNLIIAPFASKIIWHASSEQEKIDILKVFTNAQVEVVPNGVMLSEFENINIMNTLEFTNKFAHQNIETANIIISMGRLQKIKGFDILIDAFSKVVKVYPDAKLFIAGGDEGEEQNLIKQIKILKLQSSIFLTGILHNQDKIDFLANANLFVLPSHSENFGVSYLESLAAGTPIIASRNTPWSKVESADCGKWVNNSIEETAQAMIEMLGRDREEMRTNAKKLAQQYDWNYIAKNFQELFKRMIKDNNAGK